MNEFTRGKLNRTFKVLGMPLKAGDMELINEYLHMILYKLLAHADLKLEPPPEYISAATLRRALQQFSTHLLHQDANFLAYLDLRKLLAGSQREVEMLVDLLAATCDALALKPPPAHKQLALTVKALQQPVMPRVPVKLTLVDDVEDDGKSVASSSKYTADENQVRAAKLTSRDVLVRKRQQELAAKQEKLGRVVRECKQLLFKLDPDSAAAEVQQLDTKLSQQLRPVDPPGKVLTTATTIDMRDTAALKQLLLKQAVLGVQQLPYEHAAKMNNGELQAIERDTVRLDQITNYWLDRRQMLLERMY